MQENHNEETESDSFEEESKLKYEICEKRKTHPQMIISAMKNASANKMAFIQKCVAEQKLAFSSADFSPDSSILDEALNNMKSSPWYQSRNSIVNSLKDIKERYQDIESYKSQNSL